MYTKNKIIRKSKRWLYSSACFEIAELLEDAIKIPNGLVLVSGSNKVFFYLISSQKFPSAQQVLLKLFPRIPTQELTKMCSHFLVSMGWKLRKSAEEDQKNVKMGTMTMRLKPSLCTEYGSWGAISSLYSMTWP